MTQMPQLVALFNGVGGAAAALVAGAGADRATAAGTAWVARRRPARSRCSSGAVSFAGSCITFAKLQELMTGRPVTFPAASTSSAARSAAAVVAGASRWSSTRRSRRHARRLAARLLALVSLAGRGAVRAAGRRRRRADRHLAAQRVHRPDRRGVRLRAGQHAAAGRRHAGRRQRHDPDPADGRGDGPLAGLDPVRRVPALDRGGRPAPGEDRPVRSGSAGGRRDPARLRAQGRHRARATGSRWRRPSTRSASWPSCWRRAASR